MKQSTTPLWKKSCLKDLNLVAIKEFLWEISDNGDMYGYAGGDEGYYQDYKDQFDDLAGMASNLLEALNDDYFIGENWDDMTVALLGNTERVLGYDWVEQDYFAMCSPYSEDAAVQEAENRIMRLTKREMLGAFRLVLGTLLAFFDIKTAHDCLVSIVQELDEKGAILELKNREINRLYEDYTGSSGGKELDAIIEGISPRSRLWVE